MATKLISMQNQSMASVSSSAIPCHLIHLAKHGFFCNKQHDKLKILFWDTNGFWLYYRRLEQGRFQWPKPATAHTAMCIEQRQLQWLLSGLPVDNKTRHQRLTWMSVM